MNQKHTSTTKMSKVTKFGRVVTYDQELPSIKSEDPLITWFCKFEYVIFLTPQ